MNRTVVVVAIVFVLVLAVGGYLAVSGEGSPSPSPTPTAAAKETPLEPLVDVSLLARYAGTAPSPARIKLTPDCAMINREGAIDDELLVDDGRLANVLFRVIEGAAPVAGDGRGAEVVQEGCVYHPRVSGIVAGQSIALTSRDHVMHNVHTFKGDVTIFNKGQTSPSTFVKEASDFVANGEVVKNGPITFRCDVHPWMVAHVVVNPNPHFAVTGRDGLAKLSLPAGKYTIEAWHESLGTRTLALDTASPSASVEF